MPTTRPLPTSPRRGPAAHPFRLALTVALGIGVGGALSTGDAAAQPALQRMEAAPTSRPDLRTLFPERAQVFATGTAPQRVVLSPEVLAAARTDLADLRLVDARVRSIPFAVVPPSPGARQVLRSSTTLLAVDRVREPGRGDRPDRAAGERLVYAIDTPDFAFDEVVVSFDAGPAFVARVDLAGRRGDGPDDALAVDAPLFRLPPTATGGARATHRTVRVERSRADRIVLDVRIQQGRWLAPARVEVRRTDDLPPDERSHPLSTLELGHRAGRTRLRVARPAGLSPFRLSIATGSQTFLRPVRVLDGWGREVGRGTLGRFPGAGANQDQLDVALAAPIAGEVLIVEIEDGAEAPLADLAVTAWIRPPSIVFSPVDASPLHLYAGGDRVKRAPVRPLASFRKLVEDGAGAAARGPRWARALPTASLGPLGPNPNHHRGPAALWFALRPGAPLEVSRWSTEQALTLAGSPEGLAEWRPGPRTLAALRPDLSDLRLVDGHGLQMPYVLADAPGVPVELALGAPRSEDGTTRWVLSLPARPIPVRSIAIDVDEPFFDRRVRVLGRVPGEDDERVLANRQLRRSHPDGAHPGEDRSEPLTIGLQQAWIEGLAVEIDDGDDRPLTLRSASADLLGRRVLFAARAGTYRALLGNPDAEPPRYELETARDLLLALPPGRVEAGALAPNPAYRAPGLLERLDVATAALWLAIGGVITVLLVFTLRLARAEAPGGHPGDGPDGGRDGGAGSSPAPPPTTGEGA